MKTKKDDFYKDFDRNTKYKGNFSILSIIAIFLLAILTLLLIFAYYYLNK